MERGEIRPPLPQKSLNPMATKIGMGDEVGDSSYPVPLCKISLRSNHRFSPRPRVRTAYKVTWLVFSFGGGGGSGEAVPPSPLHRILTINTSNDVVSHKTKFYTSTPFAPKTLILGKFLTGQIFASKRPQQWRCSPINYP